MATISQEKDLEMLRKNADGTYTKYNPKTKASNVILGNGQNVESQLGEKVKYTDLVPITTTGTANAYIATIPSGITEITIVPHINNLVGATLNGVPILNREGVPIEGDTLVANIPTKLVRVGSNFFIASGGGGSVIIDGIQVKKKLNLISGIDSARALVDLPYAFHHGSAVVYNDEIHILGGKGDTTKHYKWNGSTWISVSTLPYEFYSGSAVVYNDEIHILGGYYNTTKHYKWNGSTWISVSTLPYGFNYGSVVVYNDEIHILGSKGYTTKHYKWNGSTWISVSTLPYEFSFGSAVIYNDEIHILGSYDNTTKHYKWNGSTWISVSTLPYGFNYGSVVVYNDEIHILGGSNNTTKHYKWNGSTWISVSTLPYEFYSGSAVVYNDEIHILGSYSSNNTLKFNYFPIKYLKV